MKIEPKEVELAKLKANSESINNLQQKMMQVQKQLQAYNKKQEQLIQGIKDRIEDCPDVPMSEWDFSQINWADFEGEIIIPEDEEDADK